MLGAALKPGHQPSPVWRGWCRTPPSPAPARCTCQSSAGGNQLGCRVGWLFSLKVCIYVKFELDFDAILVVVHLEHVLGRLPGPPVHRPHRQLVHRGGHVPGCGGVSGVWGMWWPRAWGVVGHHYHPFTTSTTAPPNNLLPTSSPVEHRRPPQFPCPYQPSLWWCCLLYWLLMYWLLYRLLMYRLMYW